MSQYLIRHIEARYERIDGQSWNEKDLPDDKQDGTIWRVNSDKKYFKRVSGQWEPMDERAVERGWQLLKTYGIGVAGESYSEYRKVTAQIDGREKTLIVNDEWANNGGAIRDDYISDQFSIVDCPLSGRGVPDDIGEETRKAMMTEDGKLRGYKHTWATVSEWETFYDSEETRILGKIKDAYQKQMNRDVISRLDFIIDNMKSPLSMDKSQRPGAVKEVDAEGNPYDDEDSIDYIIEEEMPKLYLIAQEIGKAALIADQNGLYGTSDVRIIYYIE